MNHAKRTLTEAVLARISLGAVPMDGFYWIDAKGLQHRSASRRGGAAVMAKAEADEATGSATAASSAGAVEPNSEARHRRAFKWWPLRRPGHVS